MKLRELINAEMEWFGEVLATYLQGMKDTDVSELEYELRAKRDTKALHDFLRSSLLRIAQATREAGKVEDDIAEEISAKHDINLNAHHAWTAALASYDKKMEEFMGDGV